MQRWVPGGKASTLSQRCHGLGAHPQVGGAAVLCLGFPTRRQPPPRRGEAQAAGNRSEAVTAHFPEGTENGAWPKGHRRGQRRRGLGLPCPGPASRDPAGRVHPPHSCTPEPRVFHPRRDVFPAARGHLLTELPDGRLQRHPCLEGSEIWVPSQRKARLGGEWERPWASPEGWKGRSQGSPPNPRVSMYPGRSQGCPRTCTSSPRLLRPS